MRRRTGFAGIYTSEQSPVRFLQLRKPECCQSSSKVGYVLGTDDRRILNPQRAGIDAVETGWMLMSLPSTKTIRLSKLLHRCFQFG